MRESAAHFRFFLNGFLISCADQEIIQKICAVRPLRSFRTHTFLCWFLGSAMLLPCACVRRGTQGPRYSFHALFWCPPFRLEHSRVFFQPKMVSTNVITLSSLTLSMPDTSQARYCSNSIISAREPYLDAALSAARLMAPRSCYTTSHIRACPVLASK